MAIRVESERCGKGGGGADHGREEDGLSGECGRG